MVERAATPALVNGLVTVVIPALNSARWIDAALASVLAQSYGAIEIVVVDNGSEDDTVDVVRRAAPGSRVLNASRRGPSAARNAGLDAARGEFVQFLDSDDLLQPDKVARHVAFARATGADVVWGGYARLYAGKSEDGGLLGPVVVPRIDPADVTGSLIRTEGFLHLAAALFSRRGPVATARFDESRLVVEDVQFLIRLKDSGATFLQSDSEVGFILREHDSPARASRVGDALFAQACVDNANLVAEGWDRSGVALTTERRAALASIYLHAAERFAIAGDCRALAARAHAVAMDPTCESRLPASRRLASRLLGFEAAARIARGFDRARSRARRAWGSIAR